MQEAVNNTNHLIFFKMESKILIFGENSFSANVIKFWGDGF